MTRIRPARGLRPRHWLAAFLLACLLGCGQAGGGGPTVGEALYPEGDAAAAAQTDGPGVTRDVSARERAAIARLVRIAERVRGLRFRTPVGVQVQDAQAIMTYVDTQIDDDELLRATAVYAALGLLPRELDVRALLVRLMGEQIVGYYDVDGGKLVVRDDVMRAFGGAKGDDVNLDEARVVLVHELVHALQDQALSLSQNLHEPRDTDAENAYRALVEGDATLAMIGFVLEAEGVPLPRLTSDPARIHNLSEMVRSPPLMGSELTKAPAIVRIPLLSAYVDGLTFTANLHGSGGWGRVDRAHAHPPDSTEQVLHPGRFLRREAPERVRLRQVGELLGPDFSLVHEDTLGELEVGIFFGLAAAQAVAARGAAGWGGDRLYAYRGADGQTSLVWVLAWDTEADARDAERLAREAVEAAPDGDADSHRVARRGRALLVLRHVAPGAQAHVVERFDAWVQGSRRAPGGAKKGD